MKNMGRKTLLAWIIASSIALTSQAFASDNSWHTSEAGFRALDITDGANFMLWTCGSDASIAVSKDSGAHWEVRDQTKDGGLFLSIRLRGSFGYAVGTTGFVAFTKDGGTTWQHSAVPFKDVLSASFFDSNHGLLRTRSGVFATVDGKNWSSVSDKYPSDFAKYPYVLNMAALDDEHMAVHISEPPPSGSGFLYTKDSGSSWTLLQIPSTTITSLLIQGGKYWAVGTEVIHKDQPGGGYAVPLVLFSSDGEHWEHTKHNVQMCHWEGCGGRCTHQGCLAAPSLVLSIFDETVNRIVFPPSADLTLRWATTATTICFVAAKLECAATKIDPSANPEKMPGHTPSLDAQPLMKSVSSNAVQCVLCGLESMYVDAKAHGRYQMKVSLLIDKNGLVKEIEIQNAPSQTLEESVRRSMMQWVFLPVLKDGSPVYVKLNTGINVMAVRPT
jgi:hypothetical protein